MRSLPDTPGRRRHSRSRTRAGPPGGTDGRSATRPALAWLGALTRPSDSTTPTWLRPLDWEGWLAVFALLHGARALDFVLEPAGASASAGTALWLLLYLALFGLFWYRYRLHWGPWLLRHQPLLCAVLAMAAASWFWSITPEFTWKRTIHLLGTTLIGIYIGYRFAPRTLMAILFYTFVILIVGGVAFALLLPEHGQSGFRHGGTVWTGLTDNKNQLGFIAAIAAVFFLVGTLFGRIPPLPGIGLTLLSVIALAMTRSATAIVVLPVGALSVAIFMLSKRIRAPSILTLILLLAGGAGAALFVASTDYVHDFTELLGRDASFTNRTDIWAAAWRVTLEHPWLGWGYGSLWWPTEESTFVQKQILKAGWTAAHAHNSFLNVASELGIPAGIAAIGFLLAALLGATRIYVRRASPFALFAIALMFMILVETIPEARLFMPRQVFWMLLVTMAIAAQRRAEWRQAPARRKEAQRQSRRHEEAGEDQAISSTEATFRESSDILRK